MTSRIVAMTTHRDFILIACEDGSMWKALWDDYAYDFKYVRLCDFRPDSGSAAAMATLQRMTRG